MVRRLGILGAAGDIGAAGDTEGGWGYGSVSVCSCVTAFPSLFSLHKVYAQSAAQRTP